MRNLNRFTEGLLALLLIGAIGAYARIPPNVRIGSVFLEQDSSVHQAFQAAVKGLSSGRELLNGTQIEFDIQYVANQDYFHLYTRACVEIGYGVVSIFGPSDQLLDLQLQSLSENLGIPFISTAAHSRNGWEDESDLTIALHPTQRQLVSMVRDLVEKLKWKDISIVHDPANGILDPIRLTEALQVLGPVSVHQSSTDLRATLVQLRLRGSRNIIINTAADEVGNVLQAALDTGMMSKSYTYIFTMLDMKSGNWSRLSFTEAQIFGFGFVDEEKMDDFLARHAKGKPELSSSAKIGLTIDSVELFLRGLEDFDNSGSDLSSAPFATSCTVEGNSKEATENAFWDSLKSVQFDGVTGPISFINGIRSTLSVDLLKLSHKGDGGIPVIINIGNWSEGVGDKDGISLLDNKLLLGNSEEEALNRTLLVTTIHGSSCLSVREVNGKSVEEGFCSDLAEHLFPLLGVRWKWKPVADGQYGKMDPVSSSWDGMIGEIVRGEADLALSDLTITAARQKVVDFSVPFKQTSMGVLYKQEEVMSSLILFLKPFNNWVWVSIILAFIVTSVCLKIVSWVSPYQKKDDLIITHGSDHSTLGSDLTFVNSMWLLSSSFFLRSSSDVRLKAVSSRTIAIVWWIFALLLLISYASLISRWFNYEHDLGKRSSSDVHAQVEQLMKDPSVDFGLLQGGSSHYFLQNAKSEFLQRIWWKVSKNPKGLQPSILDGVDQVSRGNGFAFIGEEVNLVEGSTSEDGQRDCSLKFLGPIAEHSYGIAMAKGSPLRERISQGILTLKEQGVLHKLAMKWEEKGGSCQDGTGNESPPILFVGDFLGPLSLLILGIVFGILFALVEKCIHYRRTHRGFFRTSTSETGNGNRKIAMNSSSSNSNED